MPKTNAGKTLFFKFIYTPLPKSSTSYKLPVILRFVYSCRTNPKIQANKIALKNDGKLIPNVLIIAMNLSNQLLTYKAEKTPNTNPTTIAMPMAKHAKKMVLGNVP